GDSFLQDSRPESELNHREDRRKNSKLWMNPGTVAGRPAGLAEEESSEMMQNESATNLNANVVLAHADIGFAARVSCQLRREGWDVYLARTGAEVRSLTKKLAPAVVVLDVDLADESGWLLCDKLQREQSGP